MDPTIHSGDPRLDALRQKLLGSAQPPDLATVHRQARRHRRRGLAGGCAVVLAVVGMLAGVLILAPAHRSESTAATGRSADTTPDSQRPRFGGWSTGAVALSGQTPEGIALQQRCVVGSSHCEARVQVTQDSGRTWQLGGPLPYVATGMLSTGLSPVLLNPVLDVLVDGQGQPVLVSGDLARTWRKIPTSTGSQHVVSAVDRGHRWLVTPRVNPAYGPGAAFGSNEILAFDLAAGTSGPLVHQPPIYLLTDARLAQTGSRQLWATGVDRSGHGEAAVSDDGGASWRRTRLGGGRIETVQIADVHAGHAALLGTRWTDADRWQVQRPLSQLWATDDGGRTFTEAEPRPERPRSVSAAQILSDGEVVVVDDSSPSAVSLVPAPGGASNGRPTLTASPTPTLRVSLNGGQSYRSIAAVSGMYEIHRVPGSDQLYGVADEAGRGPVLVTFRVHDGSLGSRQARLLPGTVLMCGGPAARRPC